MMISSPTAASPYAAAAALDNSLRSSSSADSPDSAAPDASPDVVVTLGSGAASPATYNAAGKLSGTPALDDMGANAPDSLAKASESHGDDATADVAAPQVDGSDANTAAVPDAAVAA